MSAVAPLRQMRMTSNGFELVQIQSEVDSAYDVLYADALSGRVIQWPEFNAAVLSFLRTGPNKTTMDHFFENATIGWQLLTQAGKHDAADGYWSRIVESVTAAEKKLSIQVHKGSGYYFWACNALGRDDIDKGVLLMHEALVEDARAEKVPSDQWPQSSAAKVVSLDYGGTHLASSWVSGQASAVNVALQEFGTDLRLNDIRERLFLKTRPTNVFLFVHAHALLVRLVSIPPEHRDNEFVARLALGHLFHLAVVLERVMADRNIATGKLFKEQVEPLSRILGGTLAERRTDDNGTRASSIHTQATANPDRILRALLDDTAHYNGYPVQAVDRPLCIAYVLRNLGGHESGAPSVVSERLEALRVQMLGAFVECVEAYYP